MSHLVLVGLGRFGKNHLRVLTELEVPLAVVDVDARALEEAGALAPNAKRSRSLEELLPEAFAADLVVPAPLHRPLAARCLEAGLAVFCEKPLAPTTEDARALAALAQAKDAVLQTGFIFRFHPATVAARALLAEIGPVQSLRARFTGFKRPRTDGGCAVNDAIHFVDLACLVFGKPPRTALGAVRDLLGTGHEDVAYLSFDFGPELAHIEASWHGPERAREVVLVGEGGSIAIDYDDEERPLVLRRRRHVRRGDAFATEEQPEEAPSVEKREPLRAELEDFLGNARSGRRPDADGWAGAQATAAIEAALLSAREGRAVPVPRVVP